MSKNKLNLLVVPSRTPLLYIILSVGVALILLMAFFGRTLDLGIPQLMTIFFVGLYYYLSYPDRVIKRYQLTPLPDEFLEVNKYIQALAQHETPYQLRTLLSNDLLFTFGIFKNNYLVLSRSKASELNNILREKGSTDEINSLLLHEIAHIANKDTLYSSLSQTILVAAASILSLDLISRTLQQFAFSIMPNAPSLKFLFPNICRLLNANDPQGDISFLCENPSFIISDWKESAWVLATIYIPLVIGCGLLLLFLWREVIRNREIYADAFVARKQKTVHFIKKQIDEDKTLNYTSGKYINRPLLGIWARLEKLPIFRLHDNQRRIECLAYPEKVYGSFTEIGVVIGLAVALLDLSLQSPPIAQFFPPPHATVSFVFGFVLISVSLLPAIHTSPVSTREFVNSLGHLVLVFTSFKIVPLYINYLAGILLRDLAPDFVEWIKNVPYDDYLPSGIDPFATAFTFDHFHIGSIILFTVLLPFTLFCALLLDSWCKQILSWYALDPRSMRFIQIGVTGWLAILVWLGLLPVFLSITLPQYTLTVLKIVCAVLMLGVTGIGIVWLTIRMKSYRVCQLCNCKTRFAFYLGNECPICEETLQDWLVSTY